MGKDDLPRQRLGKGGPALKGAGVEELDGQSSCRGDAANSVASKDLRCMDMDVYGTCRP